MKEFYRNEKTNDSPQWGGTNDGENSGYIHSGWGSDGDGDGDDSNSEKPEIVEPDSPYIPTADVSVLRCSASGRLMLDRSGKLICCQQQCKTPPSMLVYLKPREGVHIERHADCIQCNLIYTSLNPLLNYPEKTLTYDLWPRDYFVAADYEMKPMYQGIFPLPDPGEKLTVSFKWQRGHFDIAELSQMKIVLFGHSSGWTALSLSAWKTVAVITVDQWRHIFVNNVSAKLQGNKIE